RRCTHAWELASLLACSFAASEIRVPPRRIRALRLGGRRRGKEGEDDEDRQPGEPHGASHGVADAGRCCHSTGSAGMTLGEGTGLALDGCLARCRSLSVTQRKRADVCWADGPDAVGSERRALRVRGATLARGGVSMKAKRLQRTGIVLVCLISTSGAATPSISPALRPTGMTPSLNPHAPYTLSG